ncbi:hypothetical protein PkoCFBP13504_09720 [Pseudomonas koreensis]|uniref:hypothetical protein n=1 Tax=Pseudomonas TaxID=286 RepID=UPI0010C0AD70|nr:MULTISPECIES: hypothetical protein [Pseudomonas]MDT3310607.1 hypothetical protein [Pseudomonas sp. rhizo66]TKJ85465.1 hypothetical protein PkoCFBP13504_09720 [Pseudomonas koreensis]
MLHVLVSLDLKEADASVRTDFNAFLADVKWAKLGDVDTVWSFHIKDWEQSHHDSTKQYVVDQLMKAAKTFKLKQISIVAQIGNAKAVGHKITLKNGVHTGADFNPYA